MGPEDKTEEMVAYCDGQPVGMVTELPEITMDTEKAVEAAAALSAVWASIGIEIEVVSTALKKLWRTAATAEEFHRALHWAEVYNRPLAHRYRHTKKGRTRKKCRKRIMAWYWTEVDGL